MRTVSCQRSPACTSGNGSSGSPGFALPPRHAVYQASEILDGTIASAVTILSTSNAKRTLRSDWLTVGRPLTMPMIARSMPSKRVGSSSAMRRSAAMPA
jgi:hypothetical protein